MFAVTYSRVSVSNNFPSLFLYVCSDQQVALEVCNTRIDEAVFVGVEAFEPTSEASRRMQCRSTSHNRVSKYRGHERGSAATDRNIRYTRELRRAWLRTRFAILVGKLLHISRATNVRTARAFVFLSNTAGELARNVFASLCARIAVARRKQINPRSTYSCHRSKQINWNKYTA
jgi:hypothetical protein